MTLTPWQRRSLWEWISGTIACETCPYQYLWYFMCPYSIVVVLESSWEDYSETPLMWTPLGNTQSVLIRGVSYMPLLPPLPNKNSYMYDAAALRISNILADMADTKQLVTARSCNVVVLDCEILSKRCSACSHWDGSDKNYNSDEYKEWYEGHKDHCSRNFVGSSLAINRLWQKSAFCLGLQYTQVTCNGLPLHMPLCVMTNLMEQYRSSSIKRWKTNTAKVLCLTVVLLWQWHTC